MKTAIPGTLVDSVFKKALWVDLDEALKVELRAGGLDLTGPVLPAEVPRPVWARAISLTAGALYPAQPEGQQLRRLGRHLMAAVERQRLIRGPWLSMARLAGPRRALLTLQGQLHHSPVRMELYPLGHAEVEIRVEEREQPEFLAGVFEGTLSLLGAQAPWARVGAMSGELTSFVVGWR